MSALKVAREWVATSTIAHVSFALFAMGGWALFANRGHPPAVAMLAALVQGAVSAALTLCLKKFLEWFNAKLGGHAALVVPPLITAATILTILITAHTLAGTPEIAATIAVPFTVSTSYAILYNLKLWRGRRG